MTTGQTVRLADMCDLVAEPVSPSARPQALYLGLEHLATGRLTRIGGGQASHMRSTVSAFRPGDVLYGKLRPYLDKAVLADQAGVCTTELLVLRAKADVDPRFLSTVVHSPRFLEYAIAGTTGVQHPRTSWAHIREFEAPALLMEEQSQVADMLWLVHESIGKSEALIQETQTLRRATMRLLFTYGLRGETQKETEIGPVPANWNVKPLSDCAYKPDYGYTASASKGVGVMKDATVRLGDLCDLIAEPVRPGARPDALYLGLEHLAPGRLVSIGGGQASEMRSNTSAFQLGDVLYGKLRPYLDKAVLAASPGVCTTELLVLRAKAGVAPGFLVAVVHSPEFVEYAVAGTTGVQHPRTSWAHLREFEVPAFTSDGQREIATVLNVIDRKIDLHRRKRAVLDDLFKVLLHKLMTGEIRTTDLDVLVHSTSM